MAVSTSSSRILSKAARTAGSAPRIQSIGRASDILNALLAAPHGALQLSELSSACGLVKTTTFTLLDSLVKIGLVDRDGTGYRLGVLSISFARAVERHLDIVAIARPALIRLCTLTRETVNLAVPRPFEAFIVDSFEGSRSNRMSAYAGTSAPYHATACGRALLAFQPRALVDSLYRRGPLERYTERTLVSPGAVDDVLANCRSSGWAIEREESEIGISCIAAPIPSGGTVKAAISIAAPAASLDKEAISRYVDLLLRETVAIGQAIESQRGLTAHYNLRAS
jgi:DNA-binding IclR family transcriptional regulator